MGLLSSRLETAGCPVPGHGSIGTFWEQCPGLWYCVHTSLREGFRCLHPSEGVLFNGNLEFSLNASIR